MNWEAIGAVGEVIGAIGVILTLIYFAVQIKRHSQQLQLQNLRGQASESQQISIFQASPHMLDVIEKCYSDDSIDLDFKEKVLMESYILVHLARIRADYELRKEGIISDAAWDGHIASMAHVLTSKWAKNFWDVVKVRLDAGLYTEVDEKLKSLDVKEYYELYDSKIGASDT